jgi:general stress protein YciG
MSMSKKLKQYFSELGKKGGSVKSERKSHASRENGKKGGRPRKNKLQMRHVQ